MKFTFLAETQKIYIPVDSNDPNAHEINLAEPIAEKYEEIYNKYTEARNELEAIIRYQGINID